MKEIKNKEMLKKTKLTVLEDALDMFTVGAHKIKGEIELNNIYYTDTSIIVVLEQFMKTYSIQIPYQYNNDNIIGGIGVMKQIQDYPKNITYGCDIKKQEVYIDEDLFDDGGYIVVAEKHNPEFNILIKDKTQCKEYFDNSLVNTSNGKSIVGPAEREIYPPYNGFAIYHCEIEDATAISFMYDYSFNKLRNILICNYENDKSLMINLFDETLKFTEDNKVLNDNHSVVSIDWETKVIKIYLDDNLYTKDFQITDGFGYNTTIERIEALDKEYLIKRLHRVKLNSMYGIFNK